LIFNRSRIKTAIYVLVAIVIVGQLIRPSRIAEPVNPATDLIALTKPDTQVAQMLRTSCYDCHSGQPRYPWYFGITPVNWWLNKHINDGRKKLDATTWGTVPSYQRDHAAKDGMEQMDKKEMPIPDYFYLGRHAEAQLSDAQYLQLYAYFKSLRDGSWDIERARRNAAASSAAGSK
jgi:hypothetical protein